MRSLPIRLPHRIQQRPSPTHGPIPVIVASRMWVVPPAVQLLTGACVILGVFELQVRRWSRSGSGNREGGNEAEKSDELHCGNECGGVLVRVGK